MVSALYSPIGERRFTGVVMVVVRLILDRIHI